MIKKIISVLLIIGVALASSVEFKYCPGFDDSKIHLMSLQASPFPVKRGQKTSFFTVGQTKVKLNQAYIALDVVQSGSKVYSAHVAGPYTAPAGDDYIYTFSYGLPATVPSGAYTLQWNISDENGNVYTCYQFDANL